MIRRFVFLVLIYIFTSGCSQESPLRNISNPPATMPFTFTVPAVTPSSTTSPTLSPSPRATSILPNLVLTLTPFNQDERITKLFQEPACSFPCWWNITPGITTWNDAKSLLDFLGLPIEDKRIGLYMMHKIVFNTSGSIYKTSVEMYNRNGVVEYIAIRSFLQEEDFQYLYNNYEPEKILREYGLPDRIYANASLLEGTNYGLDFFYDEQGFIITYGGYVQSFTEKDIVICPDFSKGNILGGNIFMQSQNISSPLENSPIEGLSVEFNIMKSYYSTIEDATGLTKKEFSDLFIGDSPSYCFTIKK